MNRSCVSVRVTHRPQQTNIWIPAIENLTIIDSLSNGYGYWLTDSCFLFENNAQKKEIQYVY